MTSQIKYLYVISKQSFCIVELKVDYRLKLIKFSEKMRIKEKCLNKC
jgi:hypothetical protein